MRELIVLASAMAVVAAGAGPAGAGPDPCAEGLAHERAGDLPRAHLALERCLAAKRTPPQARAEAKAARTRALAKLEAGRFAPVSFAVKPAAVAIRIPPYTDDAPLGPPHQIWLPIGTHLYTASAPGHADLTGEVTVAGRDRILFTVSLERTTAAPGSQTVDFGDDGPAVDSPIVAADPRPKKHESLIPERFQRGLQAAPPPRRAAPRRRAWPFTLTWGF